MRPAFDKRRGCKHDRLACLGFHSSQMLIVKEVAGIHLVNGDRPERRVVVVAKILLLPFGRPRRIGVGEVVVGAGRLGFKGTWRPHARERPPEKFRRRRHGDRFAGGQRDDRLPLEKRRQLLELLTADGDELARLRMIGFGARPGLLRIAAVHAAGEALERLLGGFQLAGGDGEQPFQGDREAFVKLQLLLEIRAAEAERRPRARRQIVFEIFEVGPQRL